MNRRAAAGRLLALAALCGAAAAGGGGAAAGCGGDCCTIDSFPIGLWRAPAGDDVASPGALLARASSPDIAGGQPFTMVVDTGSPVTIMTATPGGTRSIDVLRKAIDVLDPLAPPPALLPVRAQFRNIGVLDLPLGPVGDGGVEALGVLGGDLLRAFSVELRFGSPCPANAPAGNPGSSCGSVTFWRHLGPGGGFLQDAGYAVLRFSPYGGGTVSASGDPDFVGRRSSLDIPATRVVLRTCAAPRAFVPSEPRELCCARGAEVSLSTGVDLALVVASGVGPVVLSASGWRRVSAALGMSPAMTARPLLIPWWRPAISGPPAADGSAGPVLWTTIPRLALVDLEVGPNSDPGPCIELSRARRIEWVSYQNVLGTETGACVQPCDTDPREPDKAQNSAAYIELGGAIPVAVVADDEPFLQSLRFDVRPEGPEVDGVLGAAALGGARVELDYLSDTKRAVFSCEPGAPREACWSAARCQRLPDRQQQHICFGLGPHKLPATCAPSGC